MRRQRARIHTGRPASTRRANRHDGDSGQATPGPVAPPAGLGHTGGSMNTRALICHECGQPMLRKGQKRKHPDDYRHAQGCPLESWPEKTYMNMANPNATPKPESKPSCAPAPCSACQHESKTRYAHFESQLAIYEGRPGALIAICTECNHCHQQWWGYSDLLDHE